MCKRSQAPPGRRRRWASRFPRGPAPTSTGRGDRKEAAPDGGLFGNAPLRAFCSRLQRWPQRPRLHLLAREPCACSCPAPHRARGHEVSSPAARVCCLSRSWLAEGRAPGQGQRSPRRPLTRHSCPGGRPGAGVAACASPRPPPARVRPGGLPGV